MLVQIVLILSFLNPAPAQAAEPETKTCLTPEFQESLVHRLRCSTGAVYDCEVHTFAQEHTNRYLMGALYSSLLGISVAKLGSVKSDEAAKELARNSMRPVLRDADIEEAKSKLKFIERSLESYESALKHNLPRELAHIRDGVTQAIYDLGSDVPKSLERSQKPATSDSPEQRAVTNLELEDQKALIRDQVDELFGRINKRYPNNPALKTYTASVRDDAKATLRENFGSQRKSEAVLEKHDQPVRRRIGRWNGVRSSGYGVFGGAVVGGIGGLLSPAILWSKARQCGMSLDFGDLGLINHINLDSNCNLMISADSVEAMFADPDLKAKLTQHPGLCNAFEHLNTRLGQSLKTRAPKDVQCDGDRTTYKLHTTRGDKEFRMEASAKAIWFTNSEMGYSFKLTRDPNGEPIWSDFKAGPKFITRFDVRPAEHLRQFMNNRRVCDEKGERDAHQDRCEIGEDVFVNALAFAQVQNKCAMQTASVRAEPARAPNRQ